MCVCVCVCVYIICINVLWTFNTMYTHINTGGVICKYIYMHTYRQGIYILK